MKHIIFGADACLAAVKAGLPSENYNLGSTNPPTVNELLGTLIKEAERELGWTPKDDDTSMLLLAYREYRQGLSRPS